MGSSSLEALLDVGPWAFVIVMCTPIAAIVIMFIVALLLVPKNKRVEAISAMAAFVRALRVGRRGRLP